MLRLPNWSPYSGPALIADSAGATASVSLTVRGTRQRSSGTPGPAEHWLAPGRTAPRPGRSIFNAWHYTEANLWASLATHIFDNLASGGSENDLQWRADDLADRRQAEESLLGQLSSVRLERMLLTAQQEQRAARGRTPAAVARALLRRLTREDMSWIAAELGVPEPTADDVRRFADEIVGLRAETRTLWRPCK